MKKRAVITGAICALMIMLTGIVAFADGDYDTPIIPIHTKHYYSSTLTKSPTCTQAGLRTYTCRVCGDTYTEAVAPRGHIYHYTGNQSYEGVELICEYCDTASVFSASELLEYWESGDFINQSPARTATDNSGYIDLDGNYLINAKDFAMIIKLQNNEQKLIERHNQTITGSKTEEEIND